MKQCIDEGAMAGAVLSNTWTRISNAKRSEDTSLALIQWGGPRPIDANDAINIFTADKATPPVDRVRTPQFLHLDGNHHPLAARTTHRIYFPFWQISTIACTLPSCGLIISSIPMCLEDLLKNMAKLSSGYAFSTVVVSPL
jgi:hypothetical protein